MVYLKLVFLFNKVFFAGKIVPLYPNIRPLERDEMMEWNK